ncbi:MAG: flavin reductase family protein [Firmicutes bacterium]|nr:flavin reductase family protein [Alicyclobacillaceae bacterium]MCL6496955.1 flavin reductase family protein [Bacillota bacterium]
MELDPEAEGGDALYRWLTTVVVPRPVAWVTTRSPQGKLNAAPFSFFTCLAAHPPLLGVTVMRRRGVLKDTASNALATGEFVINTVTEANWLMANATSIEAPPDYDEVAAVGLTPVQSHKVSVPGLAEAPVRLECVLEAALEFGQADGRSHPATFLVGRVVWMWMADDVVDEAGVDPRRLRAMGRMGGPAWTATQEIRRAERPRWER